MRVAERDSKQRGSKQKADRTAAGALRVMQPIGCGGAAVQRAIGGSNSRQKAGVHAL